jgi:hypothetical protein
MESLEAAMAVASGAAQDPSGRLVHKIIDGSLWIMMDPRIERRYAQFTIQTQT